MRLIDADDLRTHINNVPMHGDHKVFYDIMSELVSVVAAAPTIDTVRHGRWIAWNGEHPVWLGCFCSVCKNHADNRFKYCPNCGARMDAEEENDG